MNKFIQRLRSPWVEALNVVLQAYLIYRFTNAAIGLFKTQEITSESSVIGQFFGTRTSLLILAWAYTLMAVGLVVSLIILAVRNNRHLNTIVLGISYFLTTYTLTFIMLFNPDYIQRMLLALGYSTIIVIAWLRNMLITRKPKDARITKRDLLED